MIKVKVRVTQDKLQLRQFDPVNIVQKSSILLPKKKKKKQRILKIMKLSYNFKTLLALASASCCRISSIGSTAFAAPLPELPSCPFFFCKFFFCDLVKPLPLESVKVGK